MKSYNFWLYILQCSDESFYIGVTNHIDRRMYEHNHGLDSECYTFKRRPLALVYQEFHNYIWDALNREKQLKGWSRKKKVALINSDWKKLIEYSKRNPVHPSRASG